MRERWRERKAAPAIEQPPISPLTAHVKQRSVDSSGSGPDRIEVTGMSNQKTEKKRVTFSYVGPAAQSVLVAGDFTGWQQSPLSLRQDKKGVWRKVVSLPAGRYEYRLLVDGEWRDDPKCQVRQPNQFGGENCVCVVNGV